MYIWAVFNFFILNYLCHAKPWQIRLHCKSIYVRIPHASLQVECGHNQSLAWVPICLPSGRGSRLSSSTVLGKGGTGKDAQGRSWLSSAQVGCQEQSPREHLFPNSWVRQRGRAPDSTPHSFGPRALAPRTSPLRQTSHYKAFFCRTPTLLPDPCLHSRVIHPLPLESQQVGEQLPQQGSVLCVNYVYL